MMRPARYNPAAAFEPPRRVPVRKVPSRETFVPHDVATLEPAAAETGVSFNVGIPVLFYALGRSKPNAYGRAFVRYIGRLAGEKGPWVGLQVVEDDIETVFEVHRDGTFRGVKYFEPGDEDEDNWHGSRRFIEGERRRKTSGTSSGTSESSSIFRPPTHSTNGHARMPSLGGRPCIFVRPVDVVSPAALLLAPLCLSGVARSADPQTSPSPPGLGQLEQQGGQPAQLLLRSARFVRHFPTPFSTPRPSAVLSAAPRYSRPAGYPPLSTCP